MALNDSSSSRADCMEPVRTNRPGCGPDDDTKAALFESERRFMDVFYASDDAILLIGENTFIDCNEATRRMLGYATRAEVCMTHPSALSPPVQPDGRSSFEKADEMMRHAVEKGFHRFEWMHRRANGEDFPVEVSLTPIVHRGKNLLYCVWRDITELKKAEQALRAAEQELLQANKLQAVGQLAAGVAHELNTPAQFIGDSLEFLSESCRSIHLLIKEYRDAFAAFEGHPKHADLAARLREAEERADFEYIGQQAPAAFERALEGVCRVSTIVRAMKEFAHPDRAEKTEADLNRAITTTIAIAASEYKHVADVALQLSDIPKVMCHCGEINQVILNLIVNAAHAIADRPDHARGTITIRTAQEDQEVRISISDTGIGIPAEARARIFEPFFTTKEVGRGSGQGLSIARSIVVDKHGGSLTFDTEPGIGTTFHVVLPCDA